MNAQETLSKVHSHGETVADDKTRDFVEELTKKGLKLTNGVKVSQGDINITYLDSLDRIGGDFSEARLFAGNQIAEGTSKGASHRISSTDGMTVYKLDNANALQSFFVQAKKDFTLNHPEHGNIDFPGCDKGVYFFTHQKAHAEELRAIQD